MLLGIFLFCCTMRGKMDPRTYSVRRWLIRSTSRPAAGAVYLARGLAAFKARRRRLCRIARCHPLALEVVMFFWR